MIYYKCVPIIIINYFFILFLSIFCLYCSDSIRSLAIEVTKSKQLCIRYLIPSFLYCIYNNLAFINLSTFDPTTYYLLLQLRVVITGILFQVSSLTCIDRGDTWQLPRKFGFRYYYEKFWMDCVAKYSWWKLLRTVQIHTFSHAVLIWCYTLSLSCQTLNSFWLYHKSPH